MNASWHAFLQEQGARLDEAGRVLDFGDPAGERRAARDAGTIAPLTHLGLISCTGDDAKSFLQGQLSNDVSLLCLFQSQFSSWCSAKGRMLANFLAWQETEGYVLQLSLDLQPAVQKRLAMFVMRSKVRLADAGAARVAMGLTGSRTAEALKAFFPTLPGQPLQVVHDREYGSLIALPGDRYEIVASTDAAMRLWSALQGTVEPVSAACWEWHEIRNGLPLITAATQDQFVPQMANLELIGGVSFKKGCYPGQEIVARTQYRGQLKRRMVLGHVDGESLPLPGEALFSAGLDEEQSAGMVVNAQPAPEGGFDLLAVLQTACIAEGVVRLRSSAGPAVQLQNLPYAA